MGLDEMTGSPNIIIVPDPSTFRVLPWEPRVGWILCDDYFTSGLPFHFSPRHLLKKQVERLNGRGLRSIIGLEVEWYLLRLADDRLTEENLGAPGIKGRALQAYPVEPGYSFHSETQFDLMHEPIVRLADAYEALNLPVRSFENEWGPGQVECTFGPVDALRAADNMLLFRTATRQIVRRIGYFASFMCRPKVKGLYSSGWHLHQSVIDSTGANAFTPIKTGEPLSTLGKAYLGGLLAHGAAATVFANPTVNAYRRFRANSLAPDRLTWGTDHRGVMLRVWARFAIRPPASRTGWGSPRPIPIFISHRKSSPVWMESITRPTRVRRTPTPIARIAPNYRLACLSRSTVFRCRPCSDANLATCLWTTISR